MPATALPDLHAMRFGLDVAQHQLSWDDVLARTRFAEELGFDGAWVFDHFTALYGDPQGPCLEGWTLLAGLAAATEQIRLGALVTGITYRPPQILATEAVTVDHISAGRLELGLGAAWHGDEHRALGLAFPDRGERITRLEEGLQVIVALMTTDGATYQGEHYHLDDATYRPRPIQQPTPPIWIGASGPRTIGIAGRHADAWHTFGGPDEVVRKRHLLDQAAEEAGRDPADVLTSTNLSISGSTDVIRRTVERQAEAGVDYLIVSWPEQGRNKVEEVWADVLTPWR
jgi:F420-dependent oxidoreductase-like protein